MAAFACTDKGCVDVDLTQLHGGDHPTLTARIRAYGYRYDQDIWVDGQLYQDDGRLFWDFHEKKCTALERAGTGDRCEHQQTFECDRGEYTLSGFSWIAGDNDIAHATETVRFPI